MANNHYLEDSNYSSLPEHRPYAGLEAVTEPRYSSKEAHENVPYHPPAPEEPTSRNPFGLSPVLFGLLVGLITAVIVGGAVGGGVGGALSSRKCSIPSSSTQATTTVTVSTSSEPSATSTGTPTSSSATSSSSLIPLYTAPSPSDINLVPLNCPALNNTPYTTYYGDTFTQICGVDLQSNVSAISGNGAVIANIVGILAYSVEDCITACSKANTYVQRWGGSKCNSISFGSDLSILYPGNRANCWLKNDSLAEGQQGFQNQYYMSAVLET